MSWGIMVCQRCQRPRFPSVQDPNVCQVCAEAVPVSSEEPVSMKEFDPLHTRLLVFEARLDRFEKQLTAFEEWRAWVDKQLKELLR